MENYIEYKRRLIADYYSEHYDEINAYVDSWLEDGKDDSEDIVQSIFLRLLKEDRVITPATLPRLVYTAARNLVVDCWRRHHLCEQYEHFIRRGGSRWATGSEDLESVYSASEITALLERGMARLPRCQQGVYRLNIWGGMPVSQIAVELNLTYKCAENRLGAARKTMRRYVARMLA